MRCWMACRFSTKFNFPSKALYQSPLRSISTVSVYARIPEVNNKSKRQLSNNLISRICRSRSVHGHHTEPQVHTWGKSAETYSISTARNNSGTILDDAVDFSDTDSSLPSNSRYSNVHLRNGSSDWTADHSDRNYNSCSPYHLSTHWCPVCCTINTKQHRRFERSMWHPSSSFE